MDICILIERADLSGDVDEFELAYVEIAARIEGRKRIYYIIGIVFQKSGVHAVERIAVFVESDKSGGVEVTVSRKVVNADIRQLIRAFARCDFYRYGSSGGRTEVYVSHFADAVLRIYQLVVDVYFKTRNVVAVFVEEYFVEFYCAVPRDPDPCLVGCFQREVYLSVAVAVCELCIIGEVGSVDFKKVFNIATTCEYAAQ